MKSFLYKLIIVFIAIYFLFQLTIGSKISYFENQINSLKDDNQRIVIKDKIKRELKKAIEKENYFTEEERYLISNFLKKIRDELSLENKNQ